MNIRVKDAIGDHLLICNNMPFFDESNILAYGHQIYILEIKESLLIKHNGLALHKDIRSGKLFLFDNNWNF